MTRSSKAELEQRRSIFLGAAATIGLALVGCASRTGRAPDASHAGEESENEGEAEVTPGEDLMQEHGVLERVLLVYEESASRIERGADLDPAIVLGAAGIVRQFVQDYHEKSEETQVFPRMEAAKREVDLVATLRRQHDRGREVTSAIIASAGKPGPELSKALRAFSRMYRPHAAREDTVLFPAFREVVGRSAYSELGERFEAEEHQHFGEGGFDRFVGEVAKLETALGIGDLAQFTP
jgi:hemerythrin-like domain-containing protein